MKALVSGCAGFIGSHLIENLLKENFKVLGIDCFTDYYPREIKERNIEKNIENENFILIEKDILSLEVFPEVDYVFHFAAQPGVRSSLSSLKTYIENNIMTTHRLLEFYGKRQLKKFIYASSSSVYSDAKLPMSENDLTKPLSIYGMTKLAAEDLCHIYWKNHKTPVISLRYFSVYGEKQRPDMAIYNFIKSILNNEELLVLGDGSQTRDFTYVEDVIRANLMAARSPLSGEVLNVGSGNRISINDLISLFEKIFNKRIAVKNLEKGIGELKNTQADVSKIKKMLGWIPKVKFEDGLRRQIKWQESNSR